jgi:beta-N-acetylhexosaminidase
MSDDLGMRALSGSFADRTQAVLDAGCDLALHCSGKLEEMVNVACAAGAMSDKAVERLERAMASVAGVEASGSIEELAAKRDALLAYA